ncbi:TIM44-like domain-containing protein [Desulfovibrio sp. UCD-KL4C]|uniref:Tim44 domain-containing protein n=1 Tax=Desulfovibrio sp. UCD-KL4C TaxID=2578120 RepID=UPI0025C05CBF|nr:TIM44-like domain-containing protein [Desulfovibrio sp. UCD-KL4C]
MKLLGYVVLPLITIFLLVSMAGDANARRLGGGRSFGSKSSFSRSFSKPTTSSFSKKSSVAGTSRQRGGFARPGMGLMGGLLAGTFLGSMFGGGMGGGGGGLFNILIIGALIYFGFKFLRSRGGGSSSVFGQNSSQQQTPPNQSYNVDPFARREQNSKSAWDHLSSKPDSASRVEPVNHDQVRPEIGVPAGFDSEDFLEGAKAMYTRLQKSWDVRNIADIEYFATKGVVDEIKRQAVEDPEPSKTDIMLVNARLLEVKEEGSSTSATVYYDVLLREDANQSQPTQVREVWTFTKENTDSAMWKLDGLQQLED